MRLRLRLLLVLVVVVLAAATAAAHPRQDTASPQLAVDPRQAEQWYLGAVNINRAWEIAGGVPIKVGMLETGYGAHEDLPALAGWRDVTTEASATPVDKIGHGLFSAGIACAQAGNGKGIAGVGRRCSQLYIARVYTTGQTTMPLLATGLNWLIDQGVRVILLTAEFETSQPDATLVSALDRAAAADILMVAPAGNGGKKDATVWPAAHPAVLSIGGTDRANNRASFSNYGTGVDLAAPAVEILSATPGNQYGLQNGTSKADTIVFAIAAMMRSMQPRATAVTIANLLKQTARPLPGQNLGAGLVDAYAALSAASKLTLYLANVQR